MKKPRDQFAVLCLLPGQDGKFVAAEAISRDTEKACYKYARFLHATRPTCRCELHILRGGETEWSKLRDIPRVFNPGDRIHAIHLDVGMVVTDSIYVFEVCRVGDVMEKYREEDANLGVLRVAFVMPPRPGVKEAVRKFKSGDIVTEHWTTEFINIGSRERAEALYNEATLAWTESMKEKPEATTVRVSKLGLMAALMPLMDSVPPPQAYRER